MTSRPFLETLLGDIRSVECVPMKSIGFSGTQFKRLHVDRAAGDSLTLVVKYIHPEQDVTVWRTGGVAAREARLLKEGVLGGVWDVFDAPYLAYAFEGEVSALLMRDLSQHLFADVREPIIAEDENTLIEHLAKLHARFWNQDLSGIPWLAKGEFVFTFLAPGEIEMEEARGRTSPVFAMAKEGWALAIKMLPASVGRLLMSPPGELARIMDGLPRTLLHGDAKVANFAVLPGGRVSAFDWANISEGSPAADLGWYLAVNASRLTRSKEDFAAAYRTALERHLSNVLLSQTWERIYMAAILGGAMVLLWNKALNLKKALPGAVDEWHWWVHQLERLSR